MNSRDSESHSLQLQSRNRVFLLRLCRISINMYVDVSSVHFMIEIESHITTNMIVYRAHIMLFYAILCHVLLCHDVMAR